MHSVTRERLILAVGLAFVVAFFVTWEAAFGILAFILLVVIAPWLDIAG